MKKKFLLTAMPNRKKTDYRFSGLLKRNFTSFFICFFFINGFIHAQSVGNWTFNDILTGTPGSHNSVSSASLGSTIPTGAFNGSIVYFGEGGWPAGGLDANAYLQFSLSPSSSYTLTLSSLVMNIRRSTTGTAAGSGPTSWSLRSSLDGYTTDISNGTLTLNSTPSTNVVLPASFTGLAATVTFRLYGYNSVVTTGGLNRFVYDNITANGSIILPIIVNNFKAAAINNDAVQLAWTLNADEQMNNVAVERSSDNTDFSVIENIIPDQNTQQNQYSFIDEPTMNENGDFYYRIKITSYSGKIYYSPVQKISFTITNNFSLNAITAHQGENIRCNIKTDKAATYQFSLYNLNGAKIATKSIFLVEGNQLISMNNGSLMRGMYIVVAERSDKKVSSKLIVE
jgi:hypothetical protein